jgi:AcrR family transcriptional regulator
MPKQTAGKPKPTVADPSVVGAPRNGRRRSGAATRERILRAATELFATKGYHGTGVAEVGERAEIKRAALYYHIGSKDELLYDVVRAHVEQSLAGEEAIASSGLDHREKLRRLARHHLRTIVENREAVAIILRDASALRPERLAQVRSMQRRVEAVWQQVVQEGVEAGTFRSADPVVVRGILSMLNMAFSWYRPAGALSPEDIADRFTDLLLSGMLTEQARQRP